METNINNKLKEVALKYCKKGFSVIPLRPNSKVPLINDWQKYCTTKSTPEEVERWWRKTPNANIGIACGTANGRFLFIVDQDVLKDENKNPILDEFGNFKKRGDISGCPPTLSQTTGSGGKQLIYFAPPGYVVKNRIGLRPLVDVRGINGQFVVAPSIHPNGNEYELDLNDLDPDNITEFPKEDLDRLLGVESESKKSVVEVMKGLPIGQGERHKGIQQISGYYIKKSKTKEELELGRLAVYAWDRDINKSPESEVVRRKEIDAIYDGLIEKETSKVLVSCDEDIKLSIEEVITKCQEVLSELKSDIPKVLITSHLSSVFDILAKNLTLGDAEIYIGTHIKEKFKLKEKDVELIVKSFRENRKVILDRSIKEKAKLDLEQVDEPISLTEEEILDAEKILKSPTLLYDVLKMVKKFGVVGEEKNVLTHHIVLTSRKLKNPLSATVKGDSSAGKSFTLMGTLKVHPKSAYIDLTDATPQSFFYCKEDYFKNKIVIIFEKHGGERADYAIRTLQSEGKLKIQVTLKNPATGQFESKVIEKEGPTGFITTTTDSMIHSENDTRNISMFPDQSSEQTHRVYEATEMRYLGGEGVKEEELKPYQNAQIILEELPVCIPFVKSFKKYFPKNIVRTRRDYGHFLAFIETSALLHQMQRERVVLNGVTYIKATLADAYIAKVIIEDSLAKTIYELPEKTVEVIKTARKFLNEGKPKVVKDITAEFTGSQVEEIESEIDYDETFTKTDLAKVLNWDRDTVEKWMKPALKKNYIIIAEESRGPKSAKFKLEKKELPDEGFLPSIETLAKDNPEESIEGIYNPVSGEVVVIDSSKTET